MQGITKCRYGGPNDPLVQEMMKEKGLTEVPLYRTDGPKAEKFDLNACMQRWMAYNPDRDGPVNSDRPEGENPSHISDLIRAKAIELGGSDVGSTQLTPIMVNSGFEIEQPNIVSVIVAEDYHKVLDGALAVEAEAFEVYVECARVSTELAAYIRELGF